jgi:hypothetical protein
MRIKPTFTYNGLTVVLAQPSRKDLDVGKLLTAGGGHYFNQDCLQPTTNRYCCDIRTADTLGEGLIDGTKGLLLLGERAFREWTIHGYPDHSLNQQRGYLIQGKFRDIPTICSYAPQDAAELQNYEAKFNPLLQDEDSEDEREKETNEKDHSATRRENYRFWLQRDTKKLLHIIANGIPKEEETSYELYPNSTEVVERLSGTKNQFLFFDIETDPLYQITCFAFGTRLNQIYIVPLIRYDYTLAYSPQDVCRILRALGVALLDNIPVIHNSHYDLLITSWKYRLLHGPNVYDTMLAYHRLFPESEKSLGHVMSWCSYEPYHKDEGGKRPTRRDEEQKYWLYNGKDVRALMLAKKAIDAAIAADPGLADSIKEANERVAPYLLNTLLGIRFDDDLRQKMIKDNDALMMQYYRCIKLLAGEEVLPTSNKQMVEYFHGKLAYNVVKTSKKTFKPSLDGDALYKLKLKYPDNYVIDFAIKYRERGKETGSLKFTPWKSL